MVDGEDRCHFIRWRKIEKHGLVEGDVKFGSRMLMVLDLQKRVCVPMVGKNAAIVAHLPKSHPMSITATSKMYAKWKRECRAFEGGWLLASDDLKVVSG